MIIDSCVDTTNVSTTVSALVSAHKCHFVPGIPSYNANTSVSRSTICTTHDIHTFTMHFICYSANKRHQMKPRYLWGPLARKNGWRYNRPPIGNGNWGIKWSRDRWRHVMRTSNGWKVKVVTQIYLDANISKTVQDRLGSNGTLIGNDIWRIDWSRGGWRRDRERSRSWPRFIWRQISRKRLKIETWFQWDTNRKWHILIDWSRDRWRHVT